MTISRFSCLKNIFRNGDSQLRQHITQLKSIVKCKCRGGILVYVFMIYKNSSLYQFKQMAFQHKFIHCSLDFATCNYWLSGAVKGVRGASRISHNVRVRGEDQLQEQVLH